MSIQTLHCSTLPGQVMRLVTLAGEVERLVCPNYVAPEGQCAAKQHAAANGALGRLLERVETLTLDTRDTHCHLR